MAKRLPATVKVLFFIQSSRGTNARAIVQIPRGASKSEKRARLEDWCSQFGAWHASENAVTYGFRNVKQGRKLGPVKRRQAQRREAVKE